MADNLPTPNDRAARRPLMFAEACATTCTSGSGAYQLDPESGQVTTPDGAQVQLTPRERDVLHVLHMLRGRWVSRRELLEIVWGGYAVRDNISAQVRNIRRKCGYSVIDGSRRIGLGYGVGI